MLLLLHFILLWFTYCIILYIIWFVQLHNVKANLPPNWKIQIFWTGKGQSKHGIEVNPGVKRLIDNNDVILTQIPNEILEGKGKKKMIHLMTEEWLWENMLASKVLMFGGNSVICTNSILRVDNFYHFDYIGAPWHNFKGIGGEGGITLRTRDVMLQVIKYAYNRIKEKYKNNKDENIVKNELKKAHLHWAPDDYFFVKNMIEMNNKKITNFKLATPNDTMLFAAADKSAFIGVSNA